MHLSSSTARALARLSVRSRPQSAFSTKPPASEEQPLYLNPHAWKGLPADRIFELHNLRQEALGEKYNPNDAERNAILSTFTALSKLKPTLDYVYEIDNFKERHMNNTPVPLRGLPPKLSNVEVLDKGASPHDQRRIEQMHRVSAYEMPLLAKYRQKYEPRNDKEEPIRLTFHSDLADETNAYNRKVTLAVLLEDLALEEKQQKKFKILAGNKFNHHKQVLRFSSSQFPDATQNARWLVETFNKLLAESKDLTEAFDDIPVDTRHSRAQKPRAIFPEAWKRPQDAPVARHKIIRKLVDDVKNKKDQHHLAQYSP